MTAQVLWRLCRPTIGLAMFAMGCLFLALLVIQLAGPDTDAVQLVNIVVSILSGAALIAGLIAVIEFFLAARAFVQWTAGKGPRCPDCDWPMSPSIVLPDRCVGGKHR